jgi:hypothetical protein
LIHEASQRDPAPARGSHAFDSRCEGGGGGSSGSAAAAETAALMAMWIRLQHIVIPMLSRSFAVVPAARDAYRTALPTQACTASGRFNDESRRHWHHHAEASTLHIWPSQEWKFIPPQSQLP